MHDPLVPLSIKHNPVYCLACLVSSLTSAHNVFHVTFTRFASLDGVTVKKEQRKKEGNTDTPSPTRTCQREGFQHGHNITGTQICERFLISLHAEKNQDRNLEDLSTSASTTGPNINTTRGHPNTTCGQATGSSSNAEPTGCRLHHLKKTSQYLSCFATSASCLASFVAKMAASLSRSTA